MKYIISESQKNSSMELHKKMMFKYWDINGPKDLNFARRLFGIHTKFISEVENWLLEWMGGEDKVFKFFDKYTNKVFIGDKGSYNFKFYLTDTRLNTSHGIEIVYNAFIDGRGDVSIITDDENIINNIFDAISDENINWEVYDEIREIVREDIIKLTDCQFSLNIEDVYVFEPGKFEKTI
jgi:hypothetical protein